ncbi:MAG: 30S ribosomal protein S17 [Candidatus Aenigmatarchaeota archaeon]
MKVKNIGIDLKAPEKMCEDLKCAWHGKIKVRGRLVEGIVVSVRPQKTAIIEVEYVHYIPKYERYERRNSKLYAHLPPCISVKEGDRVIIGETRKLSKVKAFVVLQKV